MAAEATCSGCARSTLASCNGRATRWPNCSSRSRATGLADRTPEQHECSLSAPGTEAFKQDFTKWESLRKDLDLALERYDAAVSQRLAKRLAEDRLSAGGSDRVPDDYARLIARYYESLARTKK